MHVTRNIILTQCLERSLRRFFFCFYQIEIFLLFDTYIRWSYTFLKLTKLYLTNRSAANNLTIYIQLKKLSPFVYLLLNAYIIHLNMPFRLICLLNEINFIVFGLIVMFKSCNLFAFTVCCIL